MEKRLKKIEVLNAKTIKPVMKFLDEHFGYTKKFEQALALTAKAKLYAVSRAVFELPVEKLKVNSLGVYFGEWRDGQLRLSIEGSQMIGPYAEKNIVELDENQMKQWMAGEHVERTASMQGEGFVIVKYRSDFLGCGKLGESLLYNYVPKNRRIRF